MLAAAWVLVSLTQFPPPERLKGINGECLFWRSRSFSWAVDSAGNPETPGNTEFEAIDRALSSWDVAVSGCSDLAFSPSTRIPDAGRNFLVNGVPQNAIIFRQSNCSDFVPINDPCWGSDTCGDKFHCWSHAATALAVPSTSYNATTGEILHVDLELNAPAFVFSTVDSPVCVPPNITPSCVASDLESIIATHTGGALGLAFVPGAASTLGTVLMGGDIRRNIDPASAAAVCAIYPTNLPPTSCDGGTVKAPKDAGPTCNSSNCAGCCSAAGVCELGTSDSVCGKKGGRCAVCMPTADANSVCRDQACVLTLIGEKRGCGCSSGFGGFAALALALLLRRRQVSARPSVG